MKLILESLIQMTDQVSKMVDEVQKFRQECLEIKAKTKKLVALLRQVIVNNNNLYERPTRRIIEDIKQVLDKALTLVSKCRINGHVKHLFTIIHATSFRKTSLQLENSIGNVQWLLRVSTSADKCDDDDEYLGFPPIAAGEPILCLIWEHVAILLSNASLEERSDVAASLVSLACDNDRYVKLILEEGGIPPLLKLLKEGNMDGQENAAKAIGLLGRDPESVEHIVNARVCPVFAKILKEGHMQVQLVVAWAISEMAAHCPKLQDYFSRYNTISLLFSHLAPETIQEHNKYDIESKYYMFSIQPVLMSSSDSNNKKVQRDDDNNVKGGNLNHASLKHDNNQRDPHVSLASTSKKGKEFDDLEIKAQMKTMAARALWQLCKGNVTICRHINESKALPCFAILLENGSRDVKSYSTMALMEITSVAEQHDEFRRYAFKPNSPTAKAIMDQLHKIIDKCDSNLLIPCVKSVGNLANIFRSKETRFIALLVRLLGEKEPKICVEATIALNKFACTDNHLHESHCNTVIKAGGVNHLIQMIYFGDQMMQKHALTLLCYIALHVPKSAILAQQEVLIILEWCTKNAHLIGEPPIEALLPKVKSRLGL
ncbi:hypothetical protein TanjilG_17370 [Lupinus angustifolius]|uniref:DUF7792 domain-containing protein n=2 Tax=Lupinus angustifolius TaxID=3871 RepID=A0A4P1R1G6_LUPAN|nr:hypothetical protein TanjilG_17370 [Lupinus angustifolius]